MIKLYTKRIMTIWNISVNQQFIKPTEIIKGGNWIFVYNIMVYDI